MHKSFMQNFDLIVERNFIISVWEVFSFFSILFANFLRLFLYFCFNLARVWFIIYDWRWRWYFIFLTWRISLIEFLHDLFRIVFGNEFILRIMFIYWCFLVLFKHFNKLLLFYLIKKLILKMNLIRSEIFE